MKNIANIINFVRSVEPRAEDDSFLFETLEKELELCRRYGFRSTVLLQYDALIREDYRALLKEYAGETEVGLWFECVKPLVEDAGLVWRGRYVWDWTVSCSFMTGYASEEREKLVDTAFERFKELFGYYPSVAGCWTIDAHSLAYMGEKYSLKAFCNCKEQYGTDGITMWGGYYNGGYYPSKNNALLPAQSKENQIDLPVFRMLGPDPIHQYDAGLGRPEDNQGVVTLEPVYPYGGGCEKWVDWYLKENYNGKALSHSYAQFGQENSFGWTDIKKGLPMQLEKLAQKAKNGEIEIMTLGESGEWFSSEYSVSPANAMITDSDWSDKDMRSTWYYSRFYRVNIVSERNGAWIRDMQLFDDAYREQFLTDKNTSARCGNFALPVTDGFRFSRDGVRAGLYPFIRNEIYEGGTLRSEVKEKSVFAVSGMLAFTADEREFSVRCVEKGFELRFVYAAAEGFEYKEASGDTLGLGFCGFSDEEYEYGVRLKKGSFVKEDGAIKILPDENGDIVFTFG